MSILTAGNLIMILFIALSFVIVVSIVIILINDPGDGKYKYCHDCPYGSCIHEPKSAECFKFQDELKESRSNNPPCWFHSIDVESEVEKLASKKQKF